MSPDDEPESSDFIPPDPHEPPPAELWSAVGDVAPWGTALILLTWSALFATLAARGEMGESAAYRVWGASMTGLPPFETAWRLLASTFLHDGFAHVALNSLSMLIYGPAVERIFTRRGFWIIYALGGAGASLGSLAWRAQLDGASVSIGGSGAIFALGGALLAGAFRLRRRLAPGRARALGAAMLFLVFQAFSAGFTRNGTDNVAHAAGIAAGAALGLVIPLSPRLGGRTPGLAIRALGAACVLALVWSLILTVRAGLALAD